MDTYLSEIQKKLRIVVEHEKRKNGLKRLFVFCTIALALFLILVLLEAIENFNSGFRTAVFWIIVVGFISTFSMYVVFPFIKDLLYYANPDYVDAARKIGAHFPDIKDELANAIQLLEEKNQNYSDQLIDAALQNVYNKTEKINFNLVIDFTQAKKFFRIALITIVAAIAVISFVPGLSSAAYRLINFNKNFAPPPKFVFEITPGSIEIAKGENIFIRIKANGQQPSEIILSIKFSEQSEYSEKSLLPDSLGNFVFEVRSVKSSFEYFAYAEGITSDTHKISIINRPIITGIEITVFPPSYSHLPIQTQKDNGNIAALPGSKIKLALNSSRELSNAEVLFSDSSKITMRTFTTKSVGEFIVSKEINYQILIEDIESLTNINPITYSIKVMIDAAPKIELLSPIKNIKLRQESKISFVSKVADDYGFSKMNFNYRLTSSKYRQTTDEFTSLPVSISKKLKEDEIYFVWDLAPLVLAEGEALSYYLEVFDNDIINGPKSSRTQQLTITIPSLDELFADAGNKQDDVAKDLTETLKEAEQLKQEMQKISNDLKQNSKDISWQEKQRIERAAEKFEEVARKVNEISQKLTEMKNDLAKNNLLSEETLQKYNELQELLEKMNSGEMKEALKRMQESLKGLNRNNVQISMEEMKANEEYIKKSIERTLNLLKRIQVEQKVDELLKRTEELTQKIDSLKRKTEQSDLLDKPKRDELSKRQEDITKDLKNLSEEMDNLNDKMSGLKDMPKDLLDNLQKKFEKQNNERLSDEATKDIQQMQKSEAMQNQQQLSQNMKSMGKQMQSLQSSMQQMNQMKTFYDMMKILNDLLSLSKDQEELKNNTEQLSPYSNEFSKNSREQIGIQSNLAKLLQKMSDLSQKTFAVTPEMGKTLGKAFSEMQQSMNFMQSQQGLPAAQNQKNAMSSLNEAASLMKGAMDRMMSGNGQGGGMMSLMQQLQQLSQQQMSLNQLTQMLNQGQMSQEMMAQMQRLAQQQELIRKSLEQLNEEAKQTGLSKRLAGNLEKILNEMKEVVTNLQSQKMNDDLVKQQEKILTKLLDAQRSMNERDFEKERKSDAGKNFARSSPSELNLDTEEGKNKLKDELMKAIREGYKKDYEEMIRKYFEALEKRER